MPSNLFNNLSRRKFIGLSTLFLLGACGAQTTPSNSSGKNKVVFWTMQLKPQFDKYMADLIAGFLKENPTAEVEWVDIPWGEMETKILSSVAAKTAPDVVNLNPQFASKLAEKKALVDMEKAISANDKATYFPNIWKANQLDNTTFGLPWYVATDITIYNRALFEKAGLDPAKPPKTFEELAKVAEQIKAKTGKYAFMLTMDGGQVLEAMVQMGMKLLDPNGKAAFNDAAGKAAFDYWVNLFEKQLIPREILTEGHRKAVELYQSGEVAILLSGPQFLQTVTLNAPDIAKVTDVGAQITGSTGKKSAAVMNVSVPTTSTNQALAVKFALYITNAGNQLAFSKVENSLPSTTKSAGDRYFTEVAKDAPLTDRARVISASQLSQSEVLIPPAKDIEKLRKIIYEELQLAMLKEKPSDKALATAAERWNSL
ncbi:MULTISPECIES: ABC transporter substrate-binding protein [Pseudanabaena]|uniref:Carbohydrate ABC transporter substrate-binding protein, CUT1 family n=2 Tax=Pseudanabaena TaxID=1152 RepID=L8MZU5_9CYAN|nr:MULTISPECIES: sugar ABC transporter substrate-binding protein [Pseudanabaena]ELS33021.1 carbohydrate ABC transporter substrate-binding protein, CUT1 family [Pseudanabaena biceps PCC 7429]MDG3494744.1 sugar ABC transporter substrate-binding protein [Pseudanabaena catenata USMAC16]